MNRIDRSVEKAIPFPSILPKCPTGIQGLDEITGGGVPRGRITLVCGGTGCGKTLLAMQFLVNGARRYDEPGLFVSFEETDQELIQNTASLDWDLPDLIAQRKLLLDHVLVEHSPIAETGEYDLEGLFIRLGHAVEAIGAQRVVLDSIGVLFTGFNNTALLYAELRRLFRWLKAKGVTAILTDEPAQSTVSRYGLEEYISDCVIVLDHQVSGQVATRRLQVVKYRGSYHGSNEYPFLISAQGVEVLPITSLRLDYPVCAERLSSGIPRLDAMLDGKGPYRGSTILVSGTAGTGKTTLAAYFAHAACHRGERCLYFAFEEAADQIVRNLRSIGLDLAPWVDNGLLFFQADRPTKFGLEMHLAAMHRQIEKTNPQVVVVDPISNLTMVGNEDEVRLMLSRLFDFLKMRQITTLVTHLARGGSPLETTPVAISSLTDTWIVLRDVESNGERNRVLYLIKSRGMAHSNQMREFVLTDQGLELLDVYLGPTGVLTGTARYQQEAQEETEASLRQRKIEQLQRDLERRRQWLEMQIASLRAQFETEREELEWLIAQETEKEQAQQKGREVMARMRKAEHP